MTTFDASAPASTTDVPSAAIHDGALDELHRYDVEYAGGLSDHGPMVVESLVHAGRAGAVGPWLDRYARSLDRVALDGPPIPADEWQEWLGRGDVASTGRWVATIEADLAAAPWTDVVDRWVPRLSGGAATAAVHGLLRTAHAARGLSVADTPVCRHELARGLGYWASRHSELPAIDPRGDRTLLAAVDAVPLVPLEDRTDFFISARVGRIDPVGFVTALDAGHLPDAPYEALAAVVDVGLRLLAANPHEPIAFIHAVTGPVSVWSLLAVLDDDAGRNLVAAVLAAASALWAGYGTVLPSDAVADPAAPAWADLLDAAIDDGDEHKIKVTVAGMDAVTHWADDDLARTAVAAVVLPA